MKNRFDWKPRPCKRCLNLVIQNVLWSRNVHRRQQPERIDIYPFQFITVASRGYKNWLQFEQHCSHSVFNFYFFSKKSSLANVLTRTQTWSQLCSMNAKAGEYRRSELRGLDVTISARYHFGLLQENWSLSTTSSESQESYPTTGMLPYKHSSFFPPSHGSIMLPPRQPCVFARLACWQ